MRRIDLDFQRQPGRRLGQVLLVVGCLAAGGVGVAAWQQGEAVAALDARLLRLERQRPVAAASIRDLDPGVVRGLREARTVEALLGRDWRDLFAALESARNDDIALLSVEPDAERGQLLLVAEARQREAMLDYVRRLGQTPVLRDAVLIEHRVQRQVAERPIRFSLSAHWERSP